MLVVESAKGPATIEDARALQGLPGIEFVTLESLEPSPPPVDIDPPTRDLSALQGYLGPAPGVDAIAAWALGVDGTGVRMADVEYAWLVDHEEWNEGQLIPEPGQTPDLASLEGIADGNHGTAVAGELIGGDNGYGVTGIAHGGTLGVYPTATIESGSRRPDAIMAAAADSSVGDVVLLEMQIGENITGLLGPAELEESVWLATRMAVDAGIIIVAAAGNGALDLDRDEVAYYRDRGDSGAIIVGAGSPINHERLGFSSYGERVDVQGWGEAVFTTGYGAYAVYGDDMNQSYTPSFGGTSSASPIVAGVAALVQQAAKETHGTPLTFDQMRLVLRGTGIPQTGDGSENIGPLPQAAAAVEAVRLPIGGTPTISIASPDPTQTEESTLAVSFEIDVSADVQHVQLMINGELQAVIDEVPPFQFSEVVFPEGTWEIVAVGTNVWGVESSSEGVTLEVGYEPPPPAPGTSTGGSTSEVGGAGTGGGDTSGPPPAEDEDADDSTDGSSTGPVSSGGGGGCQLGPTPSPVISLCLLMGIATTRRKRRVAE